MLLLCNSRIFNQYQLISLDLLLSLDLSTKNKLISTVLCRRVQICDEVTKRTSSHYVTNEMLIHVLIEKSVRLVETESVTILCILPLCEARSKFDLSHTHPHPPNHQRLIPSTLLRQMTPPHPRQVLIQLALALIMLVMTDYQRGHCLRGGLDEWGP